MAACPAIVPHADFLGGLIQYIDCQSRTIGAAGYQALASPGSSASLILTGLLTVFVALFGYRMLLGRTPSVRDGVLAMVKIGIVLALATGWPAYRTLFYDVAFEAPGELAAEIGRPAGLIDGGSLAARLQIADRQMVDLAIAGTGEASLTPQARLAERVEPHPFGGFEAFALGSGRALYLTGAVAGFGSVRLIAGLLLALGPLFIGFLLFEGTRSLFEGWLRVLGGVAIGALGTSMAMAVELALLEPKLADWLARRAAGLPIPGAAVELLAITLIFTLMLAAVLFASVRVARGFRLATVWQIAPALRSTFTRDETFTARAETRERRAANDETRRAAVVADAVAATQRREAGQAAMAVAGAARSRARSDHMADQGLPPRQAVPLGQSFRRTQTRSSASAGRRDRRP